MFGDSLTCLHVWFVLCVLNGTIFVLCFDLSLFDIFVLFIVLRCICRCGTMGLGHEKTISNKIHVKFICVCVCVSCVVCVCVCCLLYTSDAADE